MVFDVVSVGASNILVEFELHQIFNKKHQTFILFSCLMCNVAFVWPTIANMFDARMRTTLDYSLVSLLFAAMFDAFWATVKMFEDQAIQDHQT